MRRVQREIVQIYSQRSFNLNWTRLLSYQHWTFSEHDLHPRMKHAWTLNGKYMDARFDDRTKRIVKTRRAQKSSKIANYKGKGQPSRTAHLHILNDTNHLRLTLRESYVMHQTIHVCCRTWKRWTILWCRAASLLFSLCCAWGLLEDLWEPISSVFGKVRRKRTIMKDVAGAFFTCTLIWQGVHFFCGWRARAVVAWFLKAAECPPQLFLLACVGLGVYDGGGATILISRVHTLAWG